MATYLSHQNDAIDDIVWRHYGRQAGAVEAVLAANPGLAAKGPLLPAGTRLELPELGDSSPSEVRDAVRLWD